MFVVRCAVVVGLLAPAASCVHAAAPEATIRVRVPADAPTGLPALIGVRHAFADATPAAAFTFRESGAGVEGLAQFMPDLDGAGKPLSHGTFWLAIAIEPSQRGKTLAIALAPAPARTAESPLEIETLADRATRVFDAGRWVLQYNHGPRDPFGPTSADPVLGYVHPLLGLDGEWFSQNAPVDHPHHRGLFWAWPRIERNGQPVGSWWDRRDVRYHVHRVGRRGAGPVVAAIRSEGFWDYQPAGAPKAERIIREVVDLRLFAAELTAAAGYQALDVEIALSATTDGLAMAGQSARDKGYGGFTLRLPRPDTVQIIADGQRVDHDENMYRALWADYSGDFRADQHVASDDKNAPRESGVAILTHPTHPGSPPGWCLRPYGILNPSFPGLEWVPMPRDKPIVFRYRVVLHRGGAERARIADLYKLYAADWNAKDCVR